MSKSKDPVVKAIENLEDGINNAINNLNEELGEKLDNMNKNLGEKLDRINERLDDMNEIIDDLYYKTLKMRKKLDRMEESNKAHSIYTKGIQMADVVSRGNSMDESDLEEVPYWRYRYRG